METLPKYQDYKYCKVDLEKSLIETDMEQQTTETTPQTSDSSPPTTLPQTSDSSPPTLRLLQFTRIALFLLPFVATGFYLNKPESICTNQLRTEVVVGAVGGLVAWMGNFVIEYLVIQHGIKDEKHRQVVLHIVTLFWSYSCGIMYSGVFASLC
ncbi:hypothetical protein PV04_06682 [Phialophora macrospora]|uniref:Uncharacterized protein n=1 Tax=Phialophora macrospora TaxID=1851006 RepID=A0A0D2FL21_9EURO|nr:hypothetical protein PV04_06682 [Phialophora macrospora]